MIDGSVVLRVAGQLIISNEVDAEMVDGALSYEVLQASDVELMVNLLATAFSVAEPPAVAMGLSCAELTAFVNALALRAIDEGLTILARDRSCRKLIGAVLTDDFALPPVLDLRLISKRFLPIFAMLDALDTQYRHGKTIVRGECLHLFMLAVDAEYTGRGIAQRSWSTASTTEGKGNTATPSPKRRELSRSVCSAS